MVNDVVEAEHIKKPKKDKEIEKQLFYLQYTFLSSIKHGNPYTISYLNWPDKSSIVALYEVKPNDSVQDRDLILHLKLLVADACLDALIDFSAQYRSQNKTVVAVRNLGDQMVGKIELNVPKKFITTPAEMGQDFWNLLVEID